MIYGTDKLVHKCGQEMRKNRQNGLEKNYGVRARIWLLHSLMGQKNWDSQTTFIKDK